jgi:hypothetical protein
LLAAVPHDQLAEDVRRGPHQHQHGHHAGVLLGVLVRLEELPGAVDEQVVQPRFDLCSACALAGCSGLASCPRPLTETAKASIGKRPSTQNVSELLSVLFLDRLEDRP